MDIGGLLIGATGIAAVALGVAIWIGPKVRRGEVGRRAGALAFSLPAALVMPLAAAVGTRSPNWLFFAGATILFFTTAFFVAHRTLPAMFSQRAEKSGTAHDRRRSD